MAEKMHSISFSIPESTYRTMKEKAQERGYLSVEEYVSNWVQDDAAFEIVMTQELEEAIEEGLADSQAGRVISLEEHENRHAARMRLRQG